MKRLAVLVLAVLLVLAGGGCAKEASSGEMQLGAYFDFQGITRINMQNAHNGKTTVITGEAEIAEIIDFVEDVICAYHESSKGYYEGTYGLEFYRGDTKCVSFAFGDSDCIYMGVGDDGYPLRYLLCNLTVSGDVVPFLSRFDRSLT